MISRDFKLLPDSASTLAGRVDHLYFFLCAVTVFFTTLVFVLVVYFSLRYRRTSEEPPEATRSDIRLEVAWTVIPLLITLVMFGWGARLFFFETHAPESASEINIVAKQWMWKAQHSDGRREINELTVPVGKPVKLVMTSQDAIHSFYVPAFRTKQDVVPGRYSFEWFQATRPGDYHLFCAEYCGAQHSGMIGVVHVKTQADYQAWLQATPPSETPPAVAGWELFTKAYGCAQCHAAHGPSLAGLYGSRDHKVRVGDREEVIPLVQEDYIRESILYPRARSRSAPTGSPTRRT